MCTAAAFYLYPAFGPEHIWEDASPITHVKPDVRSACMRDVDSH